MRIWRFCILIIVALFLTEAHGSDTKTTVPDSVTLQLKWRHQFQFAGYYAAIAQGYYQEAGLHVILEESSGDQSSVSKVLNGDAEFGIAMSDLAVARSQGKPVIALAAIYQHSPLSILIPRDRGISHVHDLVGKRLMLEDHSTEIEAYFEFEGIDLGQVQTLPHTYQTQDLIDGKIDAMSAYATDEPFMLKNRGIDYLLFSPRSGGIDFYGDILFTSEEQIKRYPQRVRLFLNATRRGWEYALKNHQEIIELILSQYSERHSEAHLEYEYQMSQRLIRNDLVEIGYMNPGRWRHIVETYQQFGLISSGFDVNEFIYTVENRPDLLKYTWALRISLIVLFVLFLAAFTQFLFNRRLRMLVELRTDDLSASNARLRDEIQIRKQAENTLKLYQEQLEERVADRTAELSEEIEIRKKAETAKEMLIQEIHHRVKNNLSVIQSLLNLQAAEAGDAASRQGLLECKNRVTAMSRIHDILSSSSDHRNIKMSDYFNDLIGQLVDTYVTDNRDITLQVEIANVTLDVDTVIPLGLILNELVSNVLKYAFEGRKQGTLRVSLTALEAHRYQLTVSDDGIGLPHGFVLAEENSLGLKIVNSLTKQIFGQIEAVSENGSTFQVQFSDRELPG